MDKNKKVISIKNLKQNHLVNKLIKLNKILQIGEFLTEQKLKIWYKKFILNMHLMEIMRFTIKIFFTIEKS